MLLLDSRDRQGNAWLLWNAAQLSAYTILFTAKTSGITGLVQYIITAENLFKTSINALEVMLLNSKKPCTIRFSSASFTALCKTH